MSDDQVKAVQRAIETPSADTVTPDVVDHIQRMYGNQFASDLVQRAEGGGGKKMSPDKLMGELKRMSRRSKRVEFIKWARMNPVKRAKQMGGDSDLMGLLNSSLQRPLPISGMLEELGVPVRVNGAPGRLRLRPADDGGGDKE